MKNQSVTLTITEIADLAQFAGLVIEKRDTKEEEESPEITIETCPESGVMDCDGTVIHARYIAYFEEYPEEGAMPLGKSKK